MSPPLVDLRETPLSIDEVVASVRHAGAGAICVFLGVVREVSGGRTVVRLDYEAYASMARAEMKRVVDEIGVEIPEARLGVVHRTGSLLVGDAAVVCAASAPHRDEAVRACRALIDRIKARAPIWKREHGPEGAYWVGWQDARCDETGPCDGARHPRAAHGEGPATAQAPAGGAERDGPTRLGRGDR